MVLSMPRPYHAFFNLARKKPSMNSFGSILIARFKSFENLFPSQDVKPRTLFGTGRSIGIRRISSNFLSAQSTTSSFSSGENVQVEYINSHPAFNAHIPE